MNIFEKFSKDMFEFATHSLLKWILYPLLPTVLSLFCAGFFLHRNQIEPGGPIYDMILWATIISNVVMAINWWAYPIILKRSL